MKLDHKNNNSKTLPRSEFSSEKNFRLIVLFKSLLMVMIIIWGGSVQIANSKTIDSSLVTDVGGLLFAIFSIIYLIASYQLYTLKALGKKLFIPLVLIFIILGFITEIVNPMQFNKNLFYLFVFYIVSPIFFVAQGLIIGMLYFSSLNLKFT